MAAIAQTLNDLLPLLQPARGELLLAAALVEVAEPALLVELAANPKIRGHLLARLSDTVALVDPGCEHALAKALLAAGYTPRRWSGGLS
jgi:hypothetical protein